MNDKINGEKSELLVINLKLKKADQMLDMSMPATKVYAANKGELIRFLGIWIRKRGSSRILKICWR